MNCRLHKLKLRQKIKGVYFFVKVYELVHGNDVHRESQIGENM